MLDRSKIGYAFEPFSVPVERGRLAFFAQAIGETNAIFFDRAAALEAGYRDTVVPPTFLWCLEFSRPDPVDTLDILGIDIARVLHGGQSFRYAGLAHAEDTLTYRPSIVDIYDKKGGELDFVVRETRVTNAAGKHLADLRTTLVVRN
jgi:hypothetical protein